MPEFIQVITAAGSREEAERIARSLVERRLAGCVQIVGPITSVYWWQEEVETAEEWLCLIKSERERYADLEQGIRETHSYDVPEILAVPVTAGNEDYLRWLHAELSQSQAY